MAHLQPPGNVRLQVVVKRRLAVISRWKTGARIAQWPPISGKQREQERLHALDPQHVPLYLPADDPDFPDESYTAGGPEEEDA